MVNPSSVGADLPDKTGPISGLHDHEERLNKIRDWGVVHLRATYFMENVFIILRPLYFLSNEAPSNRKSAGQEANNFVLVQYGAL